MIVVLGISIMLIALVLVGNGGGSEEVRLLHSRSVTDFSDDRRLAGWSDNMFFGQVVEKLGQTDERQFVETQFKVNVLEVLKGNVAGIITVNQQGGYEGNTLELVQGDPGLLEPGKTYLFATRLSPPMGWQHLVPKYGRVEVQVGAFAGREEILNSDHVMSLRTRFETAIASQIPFDPNEEVKQQPAGDS